MFLFSSIIKTYPIYTLALFNQSHFLSDRIPLYSIVDWPGSVAFFCPRVFLLGWLTVFLPFVARASALGTLLVPSAEPGQHVFSFLFPFLCGVSDYRTIIIIFSILFLYLMFNMVTKRLQWYLWWPNVPNKPKHQQRTKRTAWMHVICYGVICFKLLLQAWYHNYSKAPLDAV